MNSISLFPDSLIKLTLLFIPFFFVLSSCKTPTAEKSSKPLENRIALNAYSFNTPMREGTMDLFDMLEYCSKESIDAADLTGYYFPGYPEVPTDEYIYSIKKRAYLLGVDICGTGVRNDFSIPDPELREKEKDHVKEWIIVAKKLGAPSLRIFTGKEVPEGYSWEQAAEWIADDIRECAEFGEKHGVMLKIQNHHDFVKTAEEVSTLLEMINSDWTGLMLDVGSFRTNDPYRDIERTIKYAVSWQLKENVYINNEKTAIDLHKLKNIIESSDYKGYIPIETLGEGDPTVKVCNFHQRILNVFK